MTKIAELLGLKPEATEEQILKALEKRHAQSAKNEEALNKLTSDYEEASAELKKMRALPKHNTPTVNPEVLAQKVAAGLDKDKALTVLADQAEHDKSKPHDPEPKK